MPPLITYSKKAPIDRDKTVVDSDFDDSQEKKQDEDQRQKQEEPQKIDNTTDDETSDEDAGDEELDDIDDFDAEDAGPEDTQELFDTKKITKTQKDNSVYAEALNDGYMSLIRVVWRDEKEARRFAIRDVAYTQWREVCLQILATLPMSLLLELIAGNIARKYNEDRSNPVHNVLKFYLNRASQQPSIYAHILADEEGNSPTPSEFREIIGYLRDYASGNNHKLAYEIDRLKHANKANFTAAQQGVRHYLLPPLTPGKPAAKSSTTTLKAPPKLKDRTKSAKRVEDVEEFCDALEQILNGTTEPDEPLPDPPLAEVGYAMNSANRLRQHRDHRSSNWLMNLVEAICEVRLRKKYWMHQFVVFYIWSPEHAIAGEVLFSAMMQSYSKHGRGFNYESAGGSNRTVLKVNDPLWKNYEKFVIEHTKYTENIDSEEMRVKKEHSKREALLAESEKREQVLEKNRRLIRVVGGDPDEPVSPDDNFDLDTAYEAIHRREEELERKECLLQAMQSVIDTIPSNDDSDARRDPGPASRE